jgi:hypothetical protein
MQANRRVAGMRPGGAGHVYTGAVPEKRPGCRNAAGKSQGLRKGHDMQRLTRMWWVGILSGAVGLTALAQEAKAPAGAESDTNTSGLASQVKRQTLCPVMKAPINKALYVDHDGKRVYVCCRSCLARVKKDPAKYVKLLEDQGITLDRAVSATPEAPIGKDEHSEHQH